MNTNKENKNTADLKARLLADDGMEQVSGGEEPRKPRKKKRPPIQGCSSIEI